MDALERAFDGVESSVLAGIVVKANFFWGGFCLVVWLVGSRLTSRFRMWRRCIDPSDAALDVWRTTL